MNDVSGIPQYPWDEGDTVFASALNAAIANTQGTSAVFVSDTPPAASPGTLWWDSAGTGLYIRYNDGNSTQWVVAQNQNVATPPYIATGSTTSRSPQDRAHDWINVKDFGAKLDGSGDEITAYSNARAAITNQTGSVYVPHGVQDLNENPTLGPTTSVLWIMDGVTFPDHGTPVVGLGIDVVENFVGGYGKFFGRGASYAGCGSIMSIRESITHNDGTSGNTNTTMQVQTYVSGNTPEGVFGFNATISTSKNGAGDHVALSGYTNQTGGFNNSWGGNIYCNNQTGLKSSLSGSTVGMEVGCFANDVDDYSNGIRVIIDAVGVKSVPTAPDAVIGWGIRVGPSSGMAGVTFGKHYSAYGPFNHAAFSTETATQNTGANAIWLATGHTIALDTAGTSGASNTTISSNGTTVTIAGRGLTINEAPGGWSSVNVGKQLMLTDPTNSNNPGLAITDLNGANLIGIFNASGSLGIAGMPAYTDSADAPNYIVSLATTGITFNKPLTLNPLPTNAANDAAAATAGVPVNGVYRNGSVIMVRVA